MMIRIRKDENPNNIPFELKDSDLGLKYIPDSRNLFEVIDKQLFFLMVIKYSILFEEVYNFSVADFYERAKHEDLPKEFRLGRVL